MSRQTRTVTEIRERLVTYLAEQLAIDPKEVNVTQPLADFGLSSREAIEFAGDLEDWLQRELSPALVWNYPTIEALAQHLSAGQVSQVSQVSDEVAVATSSDSMQPATFDEPVAIVGMGCRFPGAPGPEAFWTLLHQGGDAIGPIPADRWDVDAFYDPDPQAAGKMYTRLGGFLPDVAPFDAGFFDISPREAMRMDPQQRLLLEVSWEALENAGQEVGQLAGSMTGVFIGISANQYLLRQLQAHGWSCIDDPYFGLGSASSVAAGRLSYLFNFQGPSLALDTACSSSLVALHLACQSLRAKECHLAVVGSVNAVVLPETMVNACKMGMLAVDGRCKTFDTRADGYALGEGCGVVVLKRLHDAQADGSNILAVVRGSAVNEDGRSSSLTAPNGLAQQAVIRQALGRAGLPSRLVSYVEAHGSGTALGDLIEMESLQAVFEHERAQPLLVGAVKTNIGHLAAAAGMAGLIKTVLSLQQRSIPAHLHLTEPNPHIAWDKNHVQVPTQRMSWEPIEGRRIAGVSSFGWSGTNAHVILEEAPVQPHSGASRAWQQLVLSAKSEEALDTATENLAQYLGQHPEVNLADVAYTLQVGRRPFSHRRVVTCRDRETAIAALETRDPHHTMQHVAAHSPRPVIFMFPGLGDQHVGMAADLYADEPVFRQTLDRCCELLQPHLGLDLRTALFAPDEESLPERAPQTLDFRRMLGRTPQHNRNGPLEQTRLAQPAVFVIEYALAQLWISWGIQPQALVGYSLGEYVAACLAGVFSLEDGLQLVARRAELIDKLPAGAMLAVSLPGEQVIPLLDDGLSLAASNGPMMCVVGGPPAAIAGLEQQFSTDGVACRQLQTTHAFHTAMMEPIQAAFRELVASMTLKPPRIPYVSNATGTWITAAQATDPSHWVAHLRQPVCFAAGIETLWEKQDSILLEVGIGQTLGSLALQHPVRSRVDDALVLSSLPAVYDRQPSMACLLRSLGQLWLAGVAVDWTGFYAHEQRQRLALPTYPFQHQRYWMSYSSDTQPKIVSPLTVEPDRQQKNELADWFYIPTWQRRPLPPTEPKKLQGKLQERFWLFFVDDCGLGRSLLEQLRERGEDVTAVVVGESFQRMQDGVYSINPASGEDYTALVQHLRMINKPPDQIVHLWNVTATAEECSQQQSFDSFDSLLFLAQALGSRALTKPVHCRVISNHMQDVLGGEGTCLQKAILLGPCKVMPKEYTLVTCTSLDIVSPVEQYSGLLLAELLSDARDEVVAYRGRTRWIQTFEPVRLEDKEGGIAQLRHQGVYLVTGGFGGLGAALATRLARLTQANLILVGRTALPPREAWLTVLADETADSQVRRRIEQVVALEAAGASVLPATADVTDPIQMQAVRDEALARFGHIHGVFHLAGVPGEGLMQFKSAEVAARVLAPKVQGSLVLSDLLRDEPLDFMVLYSSSTAVIGGLGEVDYCAANAFLDAFAHYHSVQRCVPTISINWGAWQWDAWQGTLLASLPEVYERIQQQREAYGLTFDEGDEALWRVLATRWPQVLVLTRDLRTVAAEWQALTPDNVLEQLETARQDRQTYPRPNLRTPYVAPRNQVEHTIAGVWAEALAVDQVGIHDHFFELGGNSLIGMLIISRLERAFDVELSAAALYEGPTVGTLSEVMQMDQPTPQVLIDHSVRGHKRKERQRRRQRQ